MEKPAVLLILLFGLLFPGCDDTGDEPLLMWYETPATNFNEALPLGNGRLGVMVYGGIEKELFNINEETMWGGGPADNDPNPDAPLYLQTVREELFAGEWQQAAQTLRRMQGKNVNAYVPLGDIHLEQAIEGEVTDYIRTLDLNTAVATTSFNAGDVGYHREIFVSEPVQLIIIRLKSTHKGMLSFSLSADTQFEPCSVLTTADNEFVLNGQLPYFMDTHSNIPIVEESPDGRRGMRYQLRVRAESTDGTGTISAGNGLEVTGATDVVLYVSAATSYNGFKTCPDTEGLDEGAAALAYLDAVAGTGFDKLRSDHIADYRRYFDRLKLDLGSNPAAEALPTDRRLAAYREGGNDPGLEELYFQFGRYLLISCSRPGGIPANLQGIWNNIKRPPWGSDYTTNINVQMNYWPAGMLNLLEMEEPLLDMAARWAENGREIARNFYDMGGWTIHHNSDIWASGAPVVGDPRWANWALGAPWICQHLYWHYQYTMDEQYLGDYAYPLMKGAAEFCDDWLILHDGYYITAPSTSPENVFIDDDGNKGLVTIASTMDIQIIWDLYNNLVEASEILGADPELRAGWVEKRDNLFPMRIGKAGNLMEWYGDWDDEDPQHRHVSHLFGLHPGRQISPLTTPELARAAIRTLDIRGDGGTGWSKAWKVNFWARLHDGDHAYKMYRELLSTSTLDNLFDTHPPFQIDGNFGGVAGVGEMLMQSHMGEIHLLPAIPREWEEGNVEGMLARGGYQVDIRWSGNALAKAVITASADNRCTVRTDVPVRVKGSSYDSVRDGDWYLTTFDARKGRSYTVSAL